MAKKVPPLTASAIAKFRPDPVKTIELVDGAVPGLRLRITPANSRSWSIMIRAQGVLRRFQVGEELGLADARRKAEEMRQRVKEGADPTAEKRARRGEAIAAKKGIGTLEAVLDEYFSTGNGAGLKTKAEQILRVKSVFKGLLALPAMGITSPELQRAVDGHKATVAAARAVGYVVPAVKWAVKRGLMQGAFDLEKPLLEAPAQRVLSSTELRALLPTLNEAYGRCCLFLLLTGARREEACAATWEQFDLEAGQWTIPGDGRKDTRSQAKRRIAPKPNLTVPLSKQAVSLLSDVCKAEVLRRRLQNGDPTIAAEDLVFVGPKGKRLGNWNRWVKANIERSGVKGWHPHALRRTTATLAGDLGAAPHIVSVILGHKNIGGQLIAGYNKSRYAAEHREALQKVADELDRIASASKVVPILRIGANV